MLATQTLKLKSYSISSLIIRSQGTRLNMKFQFNIFLLAVIVCQVNEKEVTREEEFEPHNLILMA